MLFLFGKKLNVFRIYSNSSTDYIQDSECNEEAIHFTVMCCFFRKINILNKVRKGFKRYIIHKKDGDFSFDGTLFEKCFKFLTTIYKIILYML